ncbi:MAG: hypothetical protein WA622_25970 [Mycobacterium sp.]
MPATKWVFRTGCTTRDTFTPPGSSEQAAMSSRSSGRSGILCGHRLDDVLTSEANDRTRKAAGHLLDQSLGSAADAVRTSHEI